jgi:transposase-like protein
MDREGTDIRKRTANMPSTHRTYDKDFRQEAVNLLLSSGRPLKRVAAELGVIPNCLRTWRNRAFGKARFSRQDVLWVSTGFFVRVIDMAVAL